MYAAGVTGVAEEVDASSRRGVAIDAATSLHWMLRLACAWCFVGHGAWGLYQKPGWLPFYAIFGVPESVAWQSMPLIGALDIALGLLVLVHPCRAALVWMAWWAIFTALLRPMAAMGWWEFLERGGNYAPPLAFLALAAAQPGLGWLGRIEPLAAVPRSIAQRVRWILRAGIAALLIGHGGFGAFEEKSMLIEHWGAIGIEVDATALRWIGGAEIAAGVAVLVSDATWLLLAIAAWKVATELLYPLSGTPMDVFEWVERGGDYFAPLALIAAKALASAARPARDAR